MLSKKYYEMIAGDIARVRGADPKPARQWAIDSVSTALAFSFAADNPKFDRARFLKACGVQS